MGPAEAEFETETVLWKDSAGPLVISRIDYPNPRHRLRLGDAVAVDVCDNGRIVAKAPAHIPRPTIHHFLADQVLPRVRAHEGQFILHAGGVAVDGHAVLLVGTTGSGKSTLTASLDQAGHRLLGDDAMAISWQTDWPHAKAVYPSLRLMPDSIAALLPEAIPTSAVAHYSAKQRITVPLAGADAPELPINAVFALAKSGDGERIAVRALTISEACMTLLENSFALDPTDVARARERLIVASKLASLVPAFEISYPRDYACLPEVRRVILDQAAALEAA